MHALEELDLTIIPQPRQIWPGSGAFDADKPLSVQLAPNADADDRFAATDLVAALRTTHGIKAAITERADSPAKGAIILQRRSGAALPPEGYRLSVTPEAVVIEGNDAAGLFWGTRTLLQAVRPGTRQLPCLEIEDHPTIRHRAIHYDSKHHQGTGDYVRRLIETLASYKANVLVWEWEDKFAYERHPEIGAPGAFTREQMQALTAFAAQRHIQLVPLVQGLGHVSYILKHPQHRHLREFENSAWEFCPLNPATYDLLFELWDEAIEATPGSEFLHIGSDETYELGQGEACGCREKAAQIGSDGLMRLFLEKATQHLQSRGRRPIAWYWPSRKNPEQRPSGQLVYTGFEEDPARLARSLEEGYKFFSYAPNPGIEPLFLSYFPWTQHSMWRDDVRRVHQGSFQDTAGVICATAKAGAVFGSITTSWDDSGLHTQAWMPRFVCAAEYSWSSGKEPEIEVWIDRFFRNYFGPQARNLRELYRLLQDGAIFYYDTFGRRVWHWGDIGMIQVPDFPRQELEYHPFWRRRYAQLLHRAAAEKQHLTRALAILDDNLTRPVEHRYDLEIYRTCAELMRHNVDLVLLLGELEGCISTAAELHFSERRRSLAELEKAEALIAAHLQDRQEVYERLAAVWERTRLPKGMSTPDKPFVWAPDRARHFANRTPDMRYLIIDEELLGLESYRQRLGEYIGKYRNELES